MLLPVTGFFKFLWINSIIYSLFDKRFLPLDLCHNKYGSTDISLVHWHSFLWISSVRELLDHMIILFKNFKELLYFFRSYSNLYSHQKLCKVFSVCLSGLVIFVFLCLSHSFWSDMTYYCALDLYFHDVSDADHFLATHAFIWKEPL